MTTLKQIQANQLQKEVAINSNFDAISPSGIFGWKGNPNGVNFNYYGGIYPDSNGKPVNIPDGSITLGINATNYICFNPTTGKVEVSQLALSDGVVPIAEVVVDAIKIISVKDTRMMKYLPLGNSGGGGYILPIASSITLGGIKVGKNLTMNPDGTLDASGGSSYTLPPATNTILGGIKVGNNLTVQADGTLSANIPAPYNLPIASNVQLGGIKVGVGLKIDQYGMTSLDYVLPTATDTIKGAIKVGSNLTVQADGTLSANIPDPYVLPKASGSVLGGIKVGKNLIMNADGTLDANGGSGGGFQFLTEGKITDVPFDLFPLITYKATGDEELIHIALIPKGGGSLTLSETGEGLGQQSLDLQVWGDIGAISDNCVCIGAMNRNEGTESLAIGFGNNVLSYGSQSFGKSNNIERSEKGENSILGGVGNFLDSNAHLSTIVGGTLANNKGFAGGYYFGSSVNAGFGGTNQQSKYIINSYDYDDTTTDRLLTADLNRFAYDYNIICNKDYETKRIKGQILVTEFSPTPSGDIGVSFDIDLLIQRLNGQDTITFIGTPKITKEFSTPASDNNNINVNLALNTNYGGLEVRVINDGGYLLKCCAVLDSIDIITIDN